MKKIVHYDQILSTLKELKKLYPTFNLGRHLSTILSDYGDPWSITDKEFAFALEKYKAQLDAYGADDSIDKIIKDGQNLDTLFNDQEEDI